MAVKFEKITLWTAVETMADKGSKAYEVDTALDHILPALNAIDGECQILGVPESEEYELVKIEEE